MLAQSEVFRALLAGLLSSLEPSSTRSQGPWRSPAEKSLTPHAQGWPISAQLQRRFFDDFFRNSSRRPFEISQKALNSRGDAMGDVFLGIVDLKGCGRSPGGATGRSRGRQPTPFKVLIRETCSVHVLSIDGHP